MLATLCACSAHLSIQQPAADNGSRGMSAALPFSAGGHLWILFEPITARVGRQLILGALPELQGVEVFPKQDYLEPKTPVGSLVRGPLGIHRLTGKRYPFVDPESLK